MEGGGSEGKRQNSQDRLCMNPVWVNLYTMNWLWRREGGKEGTKIEDRISNGTDDTVERTQHLVELQRMERGEEGTTSKPGPTSIWHNCNKDGS